ncbi:hypothetical protein [Clostridium sp.]|jgi:hypothetical protein|uniref:hypothetical protein n=1 Tax=Clostridium sp. TaxID=1506 RepID=UPI003A2A29B9
MIQIITHEQASKIIEISKPLGNFITIENGTFTGIDNITGNAFTEDFKDLKNCLAYLNGADLEDCLELDYGR